MAAQRPLVYSPHLLPPHKHSIVIIIRVLKSVSEFHTRRWFTWMIVVVVGFVALGIWAAIWIYIGKQALSQEGVDTVVVVNDFDSSQTEAFADFIVMNFTQWHILSNKIWLGEGGFVDFAHELEAHPIRTFPHILRLTMINYPVECLFLLHKTTCDHQQMIFNPNQSNECKWSSFGHRVLHGHNFVATMC